MRRVMRSSSELEREKFKYLQPKSNGGQAGGCGLLWLRSGEEFGGLTKLGSADNGIINEEQALAFDEGAYRDQLHLRDQVSLALVLRHKGAWPGRGILMKGLANGMPDSLAASHGIGQYWSLNFGYDIRVDGVSRCAGCALLSRIGRLRSLAARSSCVCMSRAVFASSAAQVTVCQDLSAAVAHFLYIDSFIAGSRVAVIKPIRRNRSSFLFAGRKAGSHRLQSPAQSRQVPVHSSRVSQVDVGKLSKETQQASSFWPMVSGGTSVAVSRSVDAIRGQQENGHGTLDHLPWAYRSPSTRLCFWLMMAAVNSVALMRPPLISMK